MTSIDPSYDDAFDSMSPLTWYPWVGINFSNSPARTLVLGESVYDMPAKARWSQRLERKDALRITHQDHALNPKKSSKFVRNIERAIFNAKKPSPLEITDFWEQVVYHNLVLRHMTTLKHRPTQQDYSSGWKEALNLFRLLKIDQCLVYGLEKQKIIALNEVLNDQAIIVAKRKTPKIGRNTPRVMEIELDSRLVKILFVRHPSAFFSWRKWAAFLEQEGFASLGGFGTAHNQCLQGDATLLRPEVIK
jgi:hypothetical protein